MAFPEGQSFSKNVTAIGYTDCDKKHAFKLALHRELGLVKTEGERIVVSEAGMPLLDALLADLVAGELVAA